MKNTIKAALVGGAAAAALAAALSGAGSANASCASLNGHGIGQGCESTVGSVSVGLGRDAKRIRRELATSPLPSATPATAASTIPTTSRPSRMHTGPAMSPLRSVMAAWRARWAPATAPSCWVRAAMPSPTAATSQPLCEPVQHVGDGGRPAARQGPSARTTGSPPPSATTVSGRTTG